MPEQHRKLADDTLTKTRLNRGPSCEPYVKTNKHDAADAEAICEAVTRPSMRFVPVKTVEQQTMAQLHRIRQLLVKQRTMHVNALRGHLAELGIVRGQGRGKGRGRVPPLGGPGRGGLPAT